MLRSVELGHGNGQPARTGITIGQIMVASGSLASVLARASGAICEVPRCSEAEAKTSRTSFRKGTPEVRRKHEAAKRLSSHILYVLRRAVGQSCFKNPLTSG